MSIKEIVKDYKKKILNATATEQDEERLLEKLEDVENALIALELAIEAEKKKQNEYLDYEKMNEDWVYKNAI